MPRQARVVAVGVPHHITHRGNNRQDVFLSDEDRRRYQTLLFEQLAPCAVDLLGWCWMTNHVHLVAVPRRADSLARLVMRVHSAYAQQFNRRYVRTGHLWQSRFFSCALGPDRLQTALLYVDLNPVRAGLVGEATAYPWSSATSHVDGRDGDDLLARSRLAQWGGCPDWAARLRRSVDAETSRRLRQATSSGVAFGDPAFIAALETRCGRRLEPRPAGGPEARSRRCCVTLTTVK